MSLLEVRLRIRGGIFRRPQALEVVHRGAPARRVAGSNHRGRQTVGRRRVVRLRRHGGAKRVERLRVLPLFEIQLSQAHGGARIGRIHPLHPRERVDGIVGPVLDAGDQAEHVIGLGPIGQQRPRRFDLAASRVGITAVEERDAEIEPGDREVRVDLERLPERGGAGGKVVLFQVCDADVVGAVGVLAARRGRSSRLQRMRAMQRDAGRGGDDGGAESKLADSSSHDPKAVWSSMAGA